MSRKTKYRRFVDLDADKLRAEVMIRAWTNEEFGEEIARHRNTVNRLLTAHGIVSVDADTARNIALALQRTRPYSPLVALQPTVAVNGMANR